MMLNTVSRFGHRVVLAFCGAFLLTASLGILASAILGDHLIHEFRLFYRFVVLGLVFGSVFGLILGRWWAGLILLITAGWLLIPTLGSNPASILCYISLPGQESAYLCYLADGSYLQVNEDDHGIFWLCLTAFGASVVSGWLVQSHKATSP